MAIAESKEMRLATVGTPIFPIKGKYRRVRRQCGAIAAAALVVAGCTDVAKPPKGTVDHIQTYFGGLAADEPRAALVARDALSAGGTAADAAVALYFALAVTFPSSAGLGSSGVCVVHGSRKKTAEAIGFPARPPARAAPAGRWAAAVPGSVRGMFALHARYGTLRWENLVRPAEQMARFGVPVSRAFVRDVARGRERLRADPESWRVFGGRRGVGPGEGETVRQLDLATVLGRLRLRGPGDFYSGGTARKIVEGVRAAGGTLAIEDLRAYRPVWIPVLEGKSGNHTVYFPGPPIAGGVIAHALWRRLVDTGRYAGAAAGERQRVVADAAADIYRGRESWITKDYGTTGFVVMDKLGGAVACNLTMGGLFGTGRMIRGTGILAAPEPDRDRDDTIAMAPMVMINKHTGDAFLASAASADGAAPLVLVTAVLSAIGDGVPLERALESGRVRPGAGRAAVLVERKTRESVRKALSRGGYTVLQTGPIGRVNVMYCPDGIERGPKLCDVQADRRGHGHAINAEF